MSYYMMYRRQIVFGYEILANSMLAAEQAGDALEALSIVLRYYNTYCVKSLHCFIIM